MLSELVSWLDVELALGMGNCREIVSRKAGDKRYALQRKAFKTPQNSNMHTKPPHPELSVISVNDSCCMLWICLLKQYFLKGISVRHVLSKKKFSYLLLTLQFMVNYSCMCDWGNKGLFRAGVVMYEAFCFFILPFLLERDIAIPVPLLPSQVCSSSHFHFVPKSKVQDAVSPKASCILQWSEILRNNRGISPIPHLMQIIFYFSQFISFTV